MKMWLCTAIIFTLVGVSIAQQAMDCNCSKADINGSGRVELRDFARLAANWLKSGTNLTGDLDDSRSVNFTDLRLLHSHWLESCNEYIQQLTVQDCNGQSEQLFLQDAAGTRFTITTQGDNLYFEDTIRANCCKQELYLKVTVAGSKITIYETEIIDVYCLCMCNYPTTAILGPFDNGTYTVEVFDIDENSLGTIEIVISSQ